MALIMRLDFDAVALPVSSISMPCDYRILQCPTKEQVKLVLYEAVRRSLFNATSAALFTSICAM